MNNKKSNSSNKKKHDEVKIKFYYSKMLAKINKNNPFKSLFKSPNIYINLLLIIIISFIIVFVFNLFSNIIRSNSDISYKYINFTEKTSDTFNKEIEKETDSNSQNKNNYNPQNNTSSTDYTEESNSPKPTGTNSFDENESNSGSETNSQNLDDTKINNNLESIIGLEINYIEKIFGSPDRIDFSENSFNWFIYNHDYSRFIMLGILDDQCVCFYTNNNFYSIFSDISPGTSINKLEQTGLNIDESNRTIWNTENINFTVFHNPKEHNNILGIYGVANILLQEKFTSNNDYSDIKYIESVELQVFDLINSYKISNNLNSYEWNNLYTSIAEKMISLKSRNDEPNQELLKEELVKLNSDGYMAFYDEQNSIFLFEKIFQNHQFDLNSDSNSYLIPKIKYNEEYNILNLLLLFTKSDS
jgi:hypothetical protein